MMMVLIIMKSYFKVVGYLQICAMASQSDQRESRESEEVYSNEQPWFML